jgi:hypothetical protein
LVATQGQVAVSPLHIGTRTLEHSSSAPLEVRRLLEPLYEATGTHGCEGAG